MIAVHTFPLSDQDGITPVGFVAGGTSAALFAVLAGVSVALLTGRQRVVPGTGRAARHGVRLAARGLAVGALGLALGQAGLGSIDIILTYYGVLFLLAVPLVLLRTRALLVVAALIVVIGPVISFAIRAQLPLTELADPSFTGLVSDPGGLLTTLFLTGAYPVLPWLAYLCVGIGVGRSSLTQLRTAWGLVAGGTVLVVAAAAVSHVALTTLGGLARITADPGLPAEELRAALTEGLGGVTPTTTWWWLAVDSAHSSTPLSMARTIGTSLLVLGAMLLLDHGLDGARRTHALRLAGGVQAPLAAAGAMTLTFYSLHVVVAGVAGDLDSLLLYLIQALFALVVGTLWQRLVGRGPLETAVSRFVDAVATSPSASAAAAGSARKRIATVVVALALTATGVGLAVADDQPDRPSSSARSDQRGTAETDSTSPGAAADDQEAEPELPSRPGQRDRGDGSNEQDQSDED